MAFCEIGRSLRGRAGVFVLLASVFGGTAVGCSYKDVLLQTVVLDSVATCDIFRRECAAGFQFDQNGAITCLPNQESVSYPGQTACYSSQVEDANAACQRYCRRAGGSDPTAPFFATNGSAAFYDLDPNNGNCTAMAVHTRSASPGECARIKDVASNGATAHALCSITGRPCNQTQTFGSTTICTSRAPSVNEPRDGCFDPTTVSASHFCGEDDFISVRVAPNKQLQEPSSQLTGVDLNFPACLQAAGSATLTYGIPPGAMGTAMHGSDTFALNATGGALAFQGGCDSNGEHCIVSQLTSMRVSFSDVVVAGVTVSNLNGRLMAPAGIVTTNGVRTIPRQNFRFELYASLPGFNTSLPVAADSVIFVNLTGQSASFSFSATIDPAFPGLGGIPVNVTANVAASSAASGAACAGFSSLQNVMGFEDLSWTSTPPGVLSLSTNPRTQGCYAISVGGGGYTVLNSARFATPLPGITPTLKLDVFVPAGQPNPNWFGAVQLYASCPSGGMYNAYLGQAELTGKPTGAFSTVSYSVPQDVRNTLAGSHNDCFFSVATNVNATPTAVVVDNLRFSL